mmetsp:Transcript_12399/g.43720  ORF Transcript_12399/g.43720 Transcript_12399/m.43720 type:complete len:296 (-) Transcript_12399:123-1010(-)
MSWYVGVDGRQVWIDGNLTVYTVGDAPAEQELVCEQLAYLSTASSSGKAQYTEHMIDEDGGGCKSNKAKAKQAGRQRGYVVRVDVAGTRVTGSMQAAVDSLVRKGGITRVDIDDTEKPKRGRNRGKSKEKEEPVEEEAAPMMPLGPNECRVEIKCRCQHFAHGRGFKVDILEPGSLQRLHMFTPEQELPVAEWHQRLLSAITETGGKAAYGRMSGGAEDGPSRGGVAHTAPPRKRDEAKEVEDDWLDSVLGRCMVPKGNKSREGGEASGAAAGDDDGEGGATPKPKKELPPWLRR